jgi:hypothetical protein
MTTTIVTTATVALNFLVTGVNFISILCSNFAAIKLQSQNVTREKLLKALMYKKLKGKIKMKLIPDQP